MLPFDTPSSTDNIAHSHISIDFSKCLNFEWNACFANCKWEKHWCHPRIMFWGVQRNIISVRWTFFLKCISLWGSGWLWRHVILYEKRWHNTEKNPRFCPTLFQRDIWRAGRITRRIRGDLWKNSFTKNTSSVSALNYSSFTEKLFGKENCTWEFCASNDLNSLIHSKNHEFERFVPVFIILRNYPLTCINVYKKREQFRKEKKSRNMKNMSKNPISPLFLDQNNYILLHK